MNISYFYTRKREKNFFKSTFGIKIFQNFDFWQNGNFNPNILEIDFFSKNRMFCQKIVFLSKTKFWQKINFYQKSKVVGFCYRFQTYQTGMVIRVW